MRDLDSLVMNALGLVLGLFRLPPKREAREGLAVLMPDGACAALRRRGPSCLVGREDTGRTRLPVGLTRDRGPNPEMESHT